MLTFDFIIMHEFISSASFGGNFLTHDQHTTLLIDEDSYFEEVKLNGSEEYKTFIRTNLSNYLRGGWNRVEYEFNSSNCCNGSSRSLSQLPLKLIDSCILLGDDFLDFILLGDGFL